MAAPTLVVVTGAPGTGKTGLAHALARAIGCPAICRDEIKEGLVHAEGDGFRPAPGDPLTMRAFPLFFRTIGLLLEGGVTVVAEAAFQDRLWRAGLEPLLPLARLRIVRCSVSDEVARSRILARAHDATRAAHADTDPGVVAPSSFEDLSLPAPSLIVDTSDGYAPELEEIVRFARHG